MTNRVTICGAFGGVNIGDEAIAETMRAQVSRAFPGARIGLDCFVSRAVLDQTGYTMSETDIASREDWRTIISWLRQGPLVIGGGQMLNGSKNGKGPGYLFSIALLARLFGQKVMLLGVGTRAVEKFPASRFFMRRLAKLANVIRVRDIQSREALIACGVSSDRIEVTADVVFSGVVAADACSSRDHRHMCLAVHQSPLVTHYTAGDYARLAIRLAQAAGSAKLDLVCHDVRPGYDLEFANAVQNEIEAQSDLAAQVIIPKTVSEAMSLYSAAGIVVSSRMHPLILGLAAGAPVLPLAGSAKVRDLASLYGAGSLLGIESTTEQLLVGLRPIAEGGVLMAGIPEELLARSQYNFINLPRKE
ncbi:polysaccharide pyruvyl transferase family protein [Pseudooceanicola sp. HF7]|uniref:polysaccharide pyruvyl transferase family protein n=1 Tax=Pseudooceanicola sp. HF7 TaxID=2721560 RepID=UPI0014321958|nr:polysaccharide pyruvyl transferase family protein [Pseudooceanicola sp. HF7]NIZ10953.1 polysaccharide pyruvyl transferase family protein [Pseudooceanicola sp. HF7]